MDAGRLLDMQSSRGAKSVGQETTQKSIDTVINECRKFIQDNSDSYRELDTDKKRQAIKNLILKYVMSNPVLVEGYVDESNRPDTNKLLDKLTEEITDYGILTAAMLDPNVFEIRANGKEIKVEIAGKVTDLRDKEGNIISFETTEQQDIILRKLLGDVRLTPKDAIVNARTVEGFRIAAVHNSVMSPDPNDPTAERYHAFVLRKFNKTKMALPDIVKKKTVSDNMARLMALMPAGGLTYFMVGPTASGKTTTANAILQSVPATTRTVLIQNPSEIDLRFKDASGRVYNDVLHLEARDIDNPSPNDPTTENLMDHTLRLSPTFVVFGEFRTNPQFKQCMKLSLAGHPISGTYHSESSRGAISRFLQAYLSESNNEPAHLALKTLTDQLNFIIVQKILRDGTRRVIQISEIVGVNPNNQNEPVINDIYIFDINREPEYDENGNVVKINGQHKRVGKISEKTIRKFQLEGVASSRYDFLLKEVDPNEVEEYTGENIDDYGMTKGKR